MRKKLKTIRTNITESHLDETHTYYKVEAEVDLKDGTITFETSKYSWGHSDWEDTDTVSSPYGTSSSYSSNPYLACFKTKLENGIPEDVEALLLERIASNVEDHLSYLDAKIERTNNERKLHQSIFTKLSNDPLVMGKKLGIT